MSRGAKGGFELGEPKTLKGRRQLAISPHVVESLKRHRVKQHEQRLAVVPAYKDLNFVFTNIIGDPLHPNTMRKRFLRLIKQASVPVIRFHDVRHSHGTLLLSSGVNPKVVSERLGHANIGITLGIYGHVLPGMQEEAAARFDSLLENAG